MKRVFKKNKQKGNAYDLVWTERRNRAVISPWGAVDGGLSEGPLV